METDRFLFDDARVPPRRPTRGKSERYRRAEGGAASGQGAGSRMRQEYRGPAST